MCENEHHCFPSKIGSGIVGFIMVVLLGMGILMLYQKLWVGLIII